MGRWLVKLRLVKKSVALVSDGSLVSKSAIGEESGLAALRDRNILAERNI
jgi:hypothetical protein